MAKNILYLCPSFPYPADNGGKVVFLNHINFLKKNGFKLHAVFFDVDDNVTELQKQQLDSFGFESYKVFSRVVPRVNDLKTLVASLFYFISSKKPRAYMARINTQLQNYVLHLLNTYKFDYVLFDHFTAFAFINSFKYLKGIKMIYIAHNVESKVIADQFKLEHSPVKKLFYYAEYLKTKEVEKEILQNATVTITISSQDYKTLKRDFIISGLIENIPEILPLRTELWQYKQTKNILFVGGTDYYPNYDAVKWLVFTLMPDLNKIDKNIICTIVGNADNFKREGLNDNILFTGRISDDELENLYKSANLFVSPVVLGSGIKVKVLTALSYGIPVLCTKESMHGIDYIDNQEQLLFDRNLPNKAVARIMELLTDEANQIQMSASIKRSMENSLNAISSKWALNNV